VEPCAGWFPAHGNTDMEPSFLSGGDQPRSNDTNWTAAVRWLGRIQNSLGGAADAANNPKPGDSFWTIVRKIARALNT